MTTTTLTHPVTGSAADTTTVEQLTKPPAPKKTKKTKKKGLPLLRALSPKRKPQPEVVYVTKALDFALVQRTSLPLEAPIDYATGVNVLARARSIPEVDEPVGGTFLGA